MNIENNLFYYATSELSQDALICYIMSFAKHENKNNNRYIYNIASKLLQLMGVKEYDITVTSIKKQYKNIDVLIEVNEKYNIIIEDKTFTSQHGNQVNRYRKTLEEEGRENIICVYYKIVEQSFEEKDIINITRNDILKILEEYNTGDKIIDDYIEYLKWIDKDVNAYKTAPIEEWRVKYKNTYRGFFTHLINNKIISNEKLGGWSYINNPSGGLWGLWWFFIDHKVMDNCGLLREYIKDLYLQISDNKITVKISKPDEITKENLEILKDIRWSLYNYFYEKLSEEKFTKGRFIQGKYMTVGYIEYNEKNYKEKIKIMEEVMNDIESGNFKYDINK